MVARAHEGALGRARASESYLRSLVEECELVRRLPSWGDREGLRTRVWIALDAVQHHTDILANDHGQHQNAREIRTRADNLVADLKVRDWAETGAPDLLVNWQRQHANNAPEAVLMNELRQAHADAAEPVPHTGVSLRGSAGAVRAYLQAQIAGEAEHARRNLDDVDEAVDL